MQDQTIGALVPASQDGADRALDEARRRYKDPDITESDLWHYIYGVLHASDWRERFAAELEGRRPRFPWAADFATFRDAGAEMMELHANYGEAPLLEGPRLVNEGDKEIRVPPEGMRWERIKNEDGKWVDDLTCLKINRRASLQDIPAEAHVYQVAGYSPLQWAVRESQPKKSEVPGEDFNSDPRWQNKPNELIAHLRQLCYVGVRTAEIVGGLPSSLSEYEKEEKEGQ